MLRNKVGPPDLASCTDNADQEYKAAFEDFLTNYKTTTSDSDQLAADALQDLNLDEDGLSDEYDFMDDVGNGKESRQRDGQSSYPRKKYMDLLQKVANRQADQVTIELDDLDNVSSTAGSRISIEDVAKVVRAV